MTVEELIEQLRELPQTAIVFTRIRKNEGFDGTMQELYEFRDVGIDTTVYSMGNVVIQLDE